MRTDEQGELSDPDLADLETATVALRAIERMAREDGATLARHDPLSRELCLDGPADAPTNVRVRYPADLPPSRAEPLDLFAATPAQDGSAAANTHNSIYRRGAARMADVARRVRSSPGVGPILQRLAWSFFRDSLPSHLDAEEQRDAVDRFYDWACFLAPVGPEGRTFACLVNDASTDLDQEERLERAALLKAIYVVTRVVSVRRGQGYSLMDVFTDELHHVKDPESMRLPRNREWFFGVLLPLGAGEYLAGGAAFSMRAVGKQERQLMELKEMDQKARPIAVEDIIFGASTDWIDELSPRELRDAYASFRADLQGARVPALSQLRKQVLSTDKPSEVFRLGANIRWASRTEVDLFGAFVKRLWNTTPRSELGGISPEESYRREHG